MKKIFLILILICLSIFVLAEEKAAGIVPKLTAAETIDAPTIVNSEVYPFWGVPCTNYTYYAIYKDEKGREPKYMRIWLNGVWHDMKLLKGDPKSGATYTYNFIPNSGNSNFYYFEASNGVGTVRDGIIDSPDNGPVLFSEKLDNNEIILLDKHGKEIWSYDTGIDWVEGVAISKDGNYIAAVTNFYVYLFSKGSNDLLWKFCQHCEIPSSLISGNMAGVAVSADGSYIAADMQGTLYFFNKDSNKPLWTANIESGSIGLDMSDDAGVIAAGTGNADNGKGQKIFLFDKEGNTLAEYKPSHLEYDQTGDFYQPDVTPDGKYVSISTGCPDRRAYLFSGSGELLFRSEMLTEDSPVHKSAISDDGSLIAYSADHQQGKEILFLYDNKGKKLWSFSSAEDGTARAVSISSDGNFVSIGTSAGHIYLFSKNSNKPIWKFTESGRFAPFGDLKLSSDGSLLAAGGTTKKVYLFSKDSNNPLWEHSVNTWITKLDFNGEYIVAGTGPREYLFEGESVSPDKIQCKEIIQPEPIENYLSMMGGDVEGGSIETEGECIGDCIERGDKDEEDKESICVRFDNDEEACIAHSDKCVWFSEDKICEKRVETKKESSCGNDLCEFLQESQENCPEDCAPLENVESSEEANYEEAKKEKEGVFRIIIDFFRRMFGK